MLIEGGNNDTTAELYDPTSGHWTYTPNMLQLQNGSTMTLLPNGTVLVAGGANNSGPTTFAEIYDPTAGTWSQTGSMVFARSSAAAALLANGQVLVAGGSGDSGVLTNAELYNPATATWTQTGSMLEAKEDFLSVLLPNGEVLATGGFSATAELYTTAGILLVNPSFQAGAFQFSFTNTPGSVNTVFTSTNPATPFASWISLGTAMEGSPGQFQFTDGSAGSFKQRFYRVSSP